MAEPLIEAVYAAARSLGAPVVTGRFRAHMQVELLEDGPVTLRVDTERCFRVFEQDAVAFRPA